MKLSIQDYKDKVRACWLGKNIGGTLGTPFEGVRGVFDVKGYTHDLSKGALPNDDLDLQLVFLRAAEEYGTRVDAHILGEYWMNQIIAHWDEYGMGKCNMRSGLLPPLSGYYKNPYGNSDGCFIRSEIWACLAPGHPEIAVKYALEDAIVDHANEGVYSEIFTAALESAAFVESKTEKLIDIAVSYIPEDCAVAGAVKLVRKCYEEGKTWREARVAVLNTYPDSFCHREVPVEECDAAPIGDVGFNAPANIGLAMIGWFYGEGDFGKSICIAASCGDDADCTCATLGAVFGIIGGTASIPKEWIDPIGEEIKTVSLDLTANGDEICKNISELTDRVTRLMPVFMRKYVDMYADGGPCITANENGLCDKVVKPHLGRPATYCFKEELKNRQPLTVKVNNPVFDAFVEYCDGLEISEGEEFELKIKADSKVGRQFWSEVTVFAPSEWEILPAKESRMLIDLKLHSFHSEHTIKLVPHGLSRGIYRFPIEIHILDRPSSALIPVTLIVK